MKQFIGTAICETEEQAIDAIEKLKSIRGAKVVHNGCEIEVTYHPDDTTTYLEETRAVALILDVIEHIRTHGFTMFP